MISDLIETPVARNFWFALQTKSNFEKLTATILEDKGFEVYCPSFRSRRRWSDRVKEIDQPLFPRYIFCRFDPDNRLPVLITPGVVSIVGQARTPEPIPDEEIRSVQQIMRSGVMAGPWPFLHVGERVIIEKGCLAGTQGILLKFKGSHRIVVSIGLLQRSIAAEIDIDSVRVLRPSLVSRPLASADRII
jgi:transcription termination/antitermination protein NusG